jgi:exopolysaccharide biosynthesis polyprenyl glycosylphosphotransferase
MLVTQRIKGLYGLFTILQLLLSGIGFWLHYYVVSEFYSEVAQPERYILYFLLVLGGVLGETLLRYNVNPSLLRLSFASANRIAFRQVIAASMLVFFFLVATKDLTISRVFLFTYAILLYFVSLVSLYSLPLVLAKRVFKGGRIENTLLVGSLRKANALKPWLDRKAELGINPIGMLYSGPLPKATAFPVLGTMENFEQVVRDYKVTQVILVEFPAMTEFLQTIIEMCELMGVHLLVVSDLEERFKHAIVYRYDDGLPLLGIRDEVLENPLNRILKRLLDVLVSLPVVVFILPPTCLLVWLIHRLQSAGPLFYVQTRAGLLNNSFRIFKFRTMHVNSSSVGQQATKGDPRIFNAGRWLRKYSIDELPQFINVLIGEMSVVGPRPHLTEHNESFSRFLNNYHIRAQVKPGITGLAQVRGFRGETRTEDQLRQRVESDIDYLENWSLAIDLLIILRTMWQVVRPPHTAY